MGLKCFVIDKNVENEIFYYNLLTYCFFFYLCEVILLS